MRAPRYQCILGGRFFDEEDLQQAVTEYWKRDILATTAIEYMKAPGFFDDILEPAADLLVSESDFTNRAHIQHFLNSGLQARIVGSAELPNQEFPPIVIQEDSTKLAELEKKHDRIIIGRGNHFVTFRKTNNDEWYLINNMQPDQEKITPSEHVRVQQSRGVNFVATLHFQEPVEIN